MTDQTDEQGLLDDIQSHRDDDAPRLVYADWLTEQAERQGQRAGGPLHDRAQFIRLQVNLARGFSLNGAPLSAQERERMQADADAIKLRHSGEWDAPLRALGVQGEVTYERGFPAGVRLDARDFVESGEELFRIAPTVTSVRLTGMSDELAGAFASIPALARLTLLYLSHNQIGDAGARALAESPYLSNLAHLYLSHNQISGEGVEAIAGSSNLRNLAHLDLSFNTIRGESARVLAASPNLSNLTHLYLRSNNISDEGARALTGSPYLVNLAHLDLEDNDIGAHRLAEIRRALSRRQGNDLPPH